MMQSSGNVRLVEMEQFDGRLVVQPNQPLLNQLLQSGEIEQTARNLAGSERFQLQGLCAIAFHTCGHIPFAVSGKRARVK